jgi:hypothetical protein
MCEPPKGPMWCRAFLLLCSRGLQPAFRPHEMSHFGSPERGLKPATTCLVKQIFDVLREEGEKASEALLL